MYTLSDFDYTLPSTQIAQFPLAERDHAKLLVLDRKTGGISHHHIYDLPHLVPPHTIFVANNTKVFPARLQGHKKTGGKVEVLLLSPQGHSTYSCIAKPGLKVGDQIEFSKELFGSITKVLGQERIIQFNLEESVLRVTLSELGEMPTPPYIKTMLQDSSRYQTIYAKYGFSAAAPTAGLHFTPQLRTQLKHEYSWLEITLNVGLGTFLPVKVDDIATHTMHGEHYTISPQVANKLNEGKQTKAPILAIGTTTMRTLESNLTYNPGGYKSALFRPESRFTKIFIYPPHNFTGVTSLLTNFHLPKSTLLMLVSAFCSYPNSPHKFNTFLSSPLGHAYQEAIAKDYRFFSFGDAMLIL